jgi:hypothetical protein
VILSVEEVQAILAGVRLQRYRVCLWTIYSCGLRLREGTQFRFVISTAREGCCTCGTARAGRIVKSRRNCCCRWPT